MKSKIAVILLAVFLCLTTGCNNASHIAQTPDPISSSDSNIVPSESETAQAEKKTEVDRPQSTEAQRVKELRFLVSYASLPSTTFYPMRTAPTKVRFEAQLFIIPPKRSFPNCANSVCS